LTSRAAERLTWLSRPLLISLRNTFRRKGRLALTLFTLTMGGAIFVAVFNVRSALNNYLDSIGHYFQADVALNFDRPYRVHEVEALALRIPGVQAVEGWAYASAEVLRPDDTVEVNLQILAPPADSKLVSPNLLSGRWIQPGDDKVVTVSEGMLEHYPGLKPGDKLRLKIAGQEDEWTVVGLFKFVGVQGLVGYASYETIADLQTQPNQSYTYRIVTDKHGEAYQDQMAAEIDRYFRARGYHVSMAEAGSDAMDTASESLDILITFLLIMALLTATVGSMGLAGTMGMNVMERTREIGVMRSIGAVDREVMRTVIVEGLIIGLLSWLVGCFVAAPITSLLSAIIGLAAFKTPLDFTFTWVGVVIWLGLVLILSALASVLPARNAARLTIREVLAYE
jgi:putative ABC transport system permease protein